MKYFVAFVIQANVTIEQTRLHIDQWTRAELTRDEAFKKFDDLRAPTLIVFDDVKKASADAEKQDRERKLAAIKAGEEPVQYNYGFFASGTAKRDVTIIYQLDIGDDKIEKMDGLDQCKVKEEAGSSVKPELACIKGLHVYMTDKFAAENNEKETVIDIWKVIEARLNQQDQERSTLAAASPKPNR